jgi:NitT/TauT family transport system permease protein
MHTIHRHPILWPAQIRGHLSKSMYVLAATVTFVIVLVTWYSFTVFISDLPTVFLPGPASVVRSLIDGFRFEGWFNDVVISSYRVFVGFLLAAFLGVPVGVLIGTFNWAEALLEPINDFVRYMPVVAFVPLSILWLGIGDAAKIAVIFIGTYFQIVLMAASAVSQVHKEYIETYLMLGGSTVGCIGRVILPASWPLIFDSLRISAGWAWSYLVVAEVVAAEEGIGFKILQSHRFLQTPKVLAAIFVVGGLGLITDYCFKAAHKRLFTWV